MHSCNDFKSRVNRDSSHEVEESSRSYFQKFTNRLLQSKVTSKWQLIFELQAFFRKGLCFDSSFAPASNVKMY